MKTFQSYLRLFLVAVLLIVIWQDVAAQQVNRTRNNGRFSMTYKDGRYELQVDGRGDIEITDDDRDIRSISNGGYLEIEEVDGRERHRIRIDGEADGRLDYQYWRDGQRAEFDNDARAWFADALLHVIRDMGIGAEARTERILARQGVNGVLDEIERIENGSVRIRYMTHLFDQAKLNSAQLGRAAGLAKEIPSPGDKTRLLIATAPYFLADASATPAFFDAAGSISSPGDKTRLLIHLVDENLLAREPAYLEALEVASGISSPGDRSRFLMKAAPAYMPQAREAYFGAVSGISSPGDHARVLIHLLQETDLDMASRRAVIHSAKSISSPGDKARVLMSASEQVAGDNELALAYLSTASTISSPGDRARVLIDLLGQDRLTREALLALLDNTKDISSPGDKTRVLLAAVDQVAGDDELTEAYIDVADTISSPGDHKRALAALLN